MNRMKKIGGSRQVGLMKEELKNLYKNRRAFLDELKAV